MRMRTLVLSVLGVGILTLSVVAAFLTRETWKVWLFPGKSGEEAKKKDTHAHGDRVELSTAAMESFKAHVKPVKPDTYWRKIWVPGEVVERRGRSDRTIATPVAGVIREVL